MISTQFHNKTRYKLILITQLYRRKIKDFLPKSESYHYLCITPTGVFMTPQKKDNNPSPSNFRAGTIRSGRWCSCGTRQSQIDDVLLACCFSATETRVMKHRAQFLCWCRNPAVTQSAEHYVPQHSAILYCNVTWLAVIPKCFCFAVIPLTVDLLQQLNQSCNTGISLSQCDLQIHKCL